MPHLFIFANMIHLNHLNLVVNNVKATTEFFETYFNFKCTFIKGDHAITILKGEDNFTLVLMPSADTDLAYPKAFHIGFMFTTPGEVNALHEKLKSGAMEVPEPKKIRDSYGFYFHFDALMIEVGHYLQE